MKFPGQLAGDARTDARVSKLTISFLHDYVCALSTFELIFHYCSMGCIEHNKASAYFAMKSTAPTVTFSSFYGL